jgi:hypothetical protein
LGIEIAPLPQLEALLVSLGQGQEGDKGKGKEVAGRVDVGKVAEKVVKNVRPLLSYSTPAAPMIVSWLMNSCSITYIPLVVTLNSRKYISSAIPISESGKSLDTYTLTSRNSIGDGS